MAFCKHFSGCYPYYNEDPFIISQQPDVYFVGNQPKFKTKSTSTNGEFYELYEKIIKQKLYIISTLFQALKIIFYKIWVFFFSWLRNEIQSSFQYKIFLLICIALCDWSLEKKNFYFTFFFFCRSPNKNDITSNFLQYTNMCAAEFKKFGINSLNISSVSFMQKYIFKIHWRILKLFHSTLNTAAQYVLWTSLHWIASDHH